MPIDDVARKAWRARRNRFFAAAFAVLAFPFSLAAATPHVRPESVDMQAVLDTAVARSATVRALVEQVQQSDVVAYLRFTRFDAATLEGRTRFIAKAGGRRYVLVEIACGRTSRVQLEILSHELRHVVEVAAAPAVVDTATLSAHYARIGMRTAHDWHRETYETQTALDTAAQVRRELAMPAISRTLEDQ